YRAFSTVRPITLSTSSGYGSGGLTWYRSPDLNRGQRAYESGIAEELQYVTDQVTDNGFELDPPLSAKTRSPCVNSVLKLGARIYRVGKLQKLQRFGAWRRVAVPTMRVPAGSGARVEVRA
ncbi:MAG: hypothetical protein ABI548_25360, partial [Polyangiaceae bacterium]